MSKIAVVIYNYPKYSETFIKYHIDNIASLVLLSKDIPVIQPNDKILVRFLKKIKQLLLHLKLKIAGINVLLAEYGTIGAEILPFAKRFSYPLAVEFRGYDLSIKKYLEAYELRYQELVSYSHALIVKSSVMKETLIKLGATPCDVNIIPSGYNIEIYDENVFSQDSKDFIFIGRLTEKKGVLYVLEAFIDFLKDHPESRLYVVGEGDQSTDCEELIENSKVGNSIRMMGVLPPKEIKELFRHCIALLNHSITGKNGDMEGVPNVILEANGSGIPVIGTRHGGIPDIIEQGKNGFLVDERATDEVTRYMQKIAEDKVLAKEMSDYGFRKVSEKYSNVISSKQLLDLINNL